MNDIMTNNNVEVVEETNELAAVKGRVNQHEERLDLVEQKNTELSGDIGKIKHEWQDFKDKEPISDEQLEELKRLGATIIFSMLGDRESEEYQAHHMIFFGHLWSDFRKEFHLSKVKNLPKKMFLAGMDFVESWEPREGVQGLMDLHDRAIVAKKEHDVKLFLQMAAHMKQEAGQRYDNN